MASNIAEYIGRKGRELALAERIAGNIDRLNKKSDEELRIGSLNEINPFGCLHGASNPFMVGGVKACDLDYFASTHYRNTGQNVYGEGKDAEELIRGLIHLECLVNSRMLTKKQYLKLERGAKIYKERDGKPGEVSSFSMSLAYADLML